MLTGHTGAHALALLSRKCFILSQFLWRIILFYIFCCEYVLNTIMRVFVQID